MNTRPSKIARQAVSIAFFVAGSGCTEPVQAGATFKIDETKWISIGAGLRTSFSAREDAAGARSDKWSKDFRIDNLRLYING